jgi:hypothetical protein
VSVSVVCRLSLVISNVILDCDYQANYINALAVSVSPFFEPAEVTLGGLIFSPLVDFFMTLGGLFFRIW